jgi:hypothetical protein
MADELLARLHARIDALAQRADDGPILEEEALREAEQLLERYYGGREAPSSGDAFDVLHAVALFHWHRHCVLDSSASRDDLDRAVTLFTRVYRHDPDAVPEQLHPLLEMRDDPAAEDPAESLTWASLAGTFLDRFRQTGDPGALRRAIALLTVELETGAGALPNQLALRSQLIAARLDLYHLTGNPGPLQEAVQFARATVELVPNKSAQRAAALSDLASALLDGWSGTGTADLLEGALQAALDAVATATPTDPNRSAYLSNLATILRSQWFQSGDAAALDEAISNLLAATAAAPIGDGGRATYLSNLAITLLARYESTGQLADLDAAIEASRSAVAATASGQLDLPARMSNLGIALLERFRRAGSLADLDAAIEASRSAVDASPDGHSRRAAMLSNLGAALRIRFARSGASQDLDAAIAVSRAAVEATPAGHTDLPGRLSNLGAALRSRFQRVGAVGDLDAAIEIGHEAVRAAPVDHPDRPGRLSNLGSALQARFEHSGAPADLDAAIEIRQEAVEATPAEHLNYAAYLFNLGAAIRARLEVTQATEDRGEALSAYVKAAELSSAAPSIRILAARRAAELTYAHEPDRAAYLLETAVRLLPEVAPRMLERGDQQYALEGMSGLASDAAALALADTSTPSAERAPRALRLLEAGRAVLLSQALDARSDLTDLRQQHAQLAARFVELRDQLDRLTSDIAPNLLRVDSTFPPVITPRYLPKDRREAAYQLTEVLAEIRSLPGFGDFGLPPDTEDLVRLAESGPVVAFSISTYRSDALLLTACGITSVELPDLSHSKLVGQVSAFQLALEEIPDAASAAQQARAQAKLSDILEWLWDVAAGPVLEALGYHDQPAPDARWPRVWWAPGGLLNLLPLHAAGYHGDNGRRTVMDRVISSYTPTLRALRHARQQAQRGADAGSALIVSMPTTPGLPSGAALPGARIETATLAARVPDSVLLVEPDSHNPPDADQHLTPENVLASLPTRANVLANLSGRGIVHFACHGLSDPVDPSRSMLLLHDYDRAPLTAAGLMSVNLHSAGLAYLAACSTGRAGPAELADEAIHLTTAFQIAGFPHVIGTLWAIGDRSAADITQTFYSYLAVEPGSMDTTRSAHALHYAVRAMRDSYPQIPFLWAAYMHSGA